MDVRRGATSAAVAVRTARVTLIQEGPAIRGARSAGRTVRAVGRVAAVIEGRREAGTLMFSIGKEIGEKKRTWSKSSCQSRKQS